jgi:hypothetical protein
VPECAEDRDYLLRHLRLMMPSPNYRVPIQIMNITRLSE